MKTEENRTSDSLKALKQLEQELASSKTHDFLEDEIVVPVQHMFPNCRRYTKCCYDDKEFWNELDKKVKEWKPVKQQFRIRDLKLKPTKPPEGFEGW